MTEHMRMQFSDTCLFSDTLNLGVYAAVYDPVATFADQQGGVGLCSFAIEFDKLLKPFVQFLRYFDRSRYLAFSIPDPDTFFAVLYWQIADIKIAQLRGSQAGIYQQLYNEFINNSSGSATHPGKVGLVFYVLP